eukprot:SAG31_NODE_2885_length_4953_cov_4.633498_2_plen_241_part_00
MRPSVTAMERSKSRNFAASVCCSCSALRLRLRSRIDCCAAARTIGDLDCLASVTLVAPRGEPNVAHASGCPRRGSRGSCGLLGLPVFPELVNEAAPLVSGAVIPGRLSISVSKFSSRHPTRPSDANSSRARPPVTCHRNTSRVGTHPDSTVHREGIISIGIAAVSASYSIAPCGAPEPAEHGPPSIPSPPACPRRPADRLPARGHQAPDGMAGKRASSGPMRRCPREPRGQQFLASVMDR